MLRLNASALRLAHRFEAELRPRFPRAVAAVRAHPAELLVRHYAGPVRYDLSDFMPLNVDRMPADVFDFLAGSAAGRWLMALRSTEKEAVAEAARRLKQRPAVCSQFQRNLEAMLALLDDCEHVAYVRCLKPRANVGVDVETEEKRFDTDLVRRQLVSCGVTATVQVCREASHSVR